MPAPHRPPPAARRALRKLGEDIRDARLRRGLPMELVAQRAATSRPTVARVEKGDPGVSIGIVAAVLQALGLLDKLADIADPARDEVGQQLARESLPQRARTSRKRTEPDGE